MGHVYEERSRFINGWALYRVRGNTVVVHQHSSLEPVDIMEAGRHKSQKWNIPRCFNVRDWTRPRFTPEEFCIATDFDIQNAPEFLYFLLRGDQITTYTEFTFILEWTVCRRKCLFWTWIYCKRWVVNDHYGRKRIGKRVENMLSSYPVYNK